MFQTFHRGQTLPAVDRWHVHGRRPLYSSPWVSLDLIDVEPPGAPRYEHHVVHLDQDAVAVVVHHEERGVLLLYRHRFATDTVGFEVPAGGMDPEESAADAARREVLEETGWIVSEPKVFHSCNASDGMSDQRFHFAFATAERFTGHIQDQHESSALCWVPVDQLTALITDGLIPSAGSSLALLLAQTLGFLASDTGPQAQP